MLEMLLVGGQVLLKMWWLILVPVVGVVACEAYLKKYGDAFGEEFDK